MIFILLPAYNEGGNIHPLLETLAAEAKTYYGQDASIPYPIHAVVVDDGSQDETAQRTRDFSGPIQVTLIQHDRNRGLSSALRTGIEWILQEGREGDWIITLDADQTHHPRFIFDIIKTLETGCEVVVASRFAPGGKEYGVSAWRKFLSHGARTIYHFCFPKIPLRDFSCGFRGFAYSVLKSVHTQWGDHLLESEGFACTGELMLKTLSHTSSDRVTEIPFELHYEQKAGESKMPTIKTILGTLKLIWKARGWMRR